MFGSHLSIAGSMANALLEAERLKMDAVQVFTKSQRQWAVRPLDPGVVADWQAEVRRLGWQDRTVSHASYLINLASPDDALWRKSIDLMTVEVERCETLEIAYLVHHPGAFTSSTPAEGLGRIAEAYKELLRRVRGGRVVLCLENTVGSGSNLGRSFEELATLRAMILDRVGEPGRVGYCFDTCHAHAGGYSMASLAEGEGVLDEFDRTCGLKNLRVVHVNDSKGDAGSRLDRHAHIGEGTIGRSTRVDRLRASGFAALVNREGLEGVPKILETPKGATPAGTPYDTLNLRRLRKLVGGG